MLPKVASSPSGAAFGSVLGLMAFFYFFARLTLFCAAWIATAQYEDHETSSEETVSAAGSSQNVSENESS